QHASAVRSVQVSADGRKLLTTCSDFTAQLWDLSQASGAGHHGSGVSSVEPASSRPLSPLEKVTAAVLSPDGRWVLAGSQEGTAKLLKVADGMMLHPVLNHRARISSIG